VIGKSVSWDNDFSLLFNFGIGLSVYTFSKTHMQPILENELVKAFVLAEIDVQD